MMGADSVCTVVWIKRGQRIIEVSDVRSFAREVGALIEDRAGDKVSGRRLRKFARNCLCPVDIDASAMAAGYTVSRPGWPDYLLTK